MHLAAQRQSRCPVPCLSCPQELLGEVQIPFAARDRACPIKAAHALKQVELPAEVSLRREVGWNKWLKREKNLLKYRTASSPSPFSCYSSSDPLQLQRSHTWTCCAPGLQGTEEEAGVASFSSHKKGAECQPGECVK